MIIGIVIGHVWSTKKEESYNGLKLMIVQRMEPSDKSMHESFVAVDCVGAGIGERVLVACGSAARKALRNQESPVDASIVCILDDPESSKA